MKKNAIISVVNIQDGTDDKIEVITPGRFYSKDDKYYVIYEETEISGMQGTTTSLKIEKDKFTLKRKGSTNTVMKFIPNTQDFIMYQTPHGMLQLSLTVKDVEINVDENGGSLKATYDMGVGLDESIRTEIAVDIKISDK